MYQNGPKTLVGPRRGTPGWWQELGRLDAIATPNTRQRARKCARQTTQRSSQIRTELVERVRREIAAGTYDTPQKWEAALDRLLDGLCPE